MRRSLFLALAALAATPALSSALDLTPEEQTFIDQHTANLVKFETKRMEDPALGEVFSAPVYSIKVVIQFPGNESSTTVTAARVADELLVITQPGEDCDVPSVMRMLNPAFKLRGVPEATMLQQALDVTFPILMRSEREARTFRRNGNQWIFIRGEFFDKKSGFIFETDPKGTVKSVKYRLGI